MFKRRKEERIEIHQDRMDEVPDHTISYVSVQLLRELARRHGCSLTHEVELLHSACRQYDEMMDARMAE